LELAFFGLNPSYKSIILEEINFLCYYGHGGFTHDEVYSMPIRYRQYHIKKVVEFLEKEAEAINGPSNNINNNKPLGPALKPDFSTKVKAPKK
jgi:hypothetical protein